MNVRGMKWSNFADIFYEEEVQDYTYMLYLSILKIFLQWRLITLGLFSSCKRTGKWKNSAMNIYFLIIILK